MPAEERRQLSVKLLSISSAVTDPQSRRLPAVGGRRGADSTDCLIFGKKKKHLNRDSVRRGDGLLGYLVCLAT